MGGRMAAYENSGEVFLRGSISSRGGRSYSALQELDSSSFLPSSKFGRNSKLSRYGQRFKYWILRGLLRDGLRPTCEEV
jgi:hypothetical protein